MLITTLLASVLVMLAAFSAKLITWRGIGAHIERNMHFFVSFAAGVLLVIAWNLGEEIVEHSGSFSTGLPWIAIGAFVVLVAFRYVPHFHHHHEKAEHAHSLIDANRVLASDAIHNIGDGIVIVVSFAASFTIGIASTLSILVHEMLQETSQFFVLREAGMSEKRALIMNFFVSSTILIGTLGAYFLLSYFDTLEVPLLGLSVGAYLVVVFHDLIPHSLSKATSASHYVRHLAFFIVGFLLMGLLVTLLPHTEPHTEAAGGLGSVEYTVSQ